MAVATAAVVGIAASGYSAYKGFSDAAKAKKMEEDAQQDAKEAMNDARKRAEKDYYAGLTVPLDAYDQQFENNLAVAQQTTEALQEGDARALAAGAGRVGAQAAQQAEDTRIAMGKEVSQLQGTKAQSKDAINQQLMEMDVAYAREQKQIAADAAQRRSQAIQQGVSGLASTVSAIGGAAPLFGSGGGGGGNMPGGGPSLTEQAAQSQLTTGAGGLTGGNQSAFGTGGGPGLNYNNPFQQQSAFGSFTPDPSTQFFSDRRLKEKIKLIGQSPSGLNIYSFKYKNEEGMYQGVMSDEIDPQAVVKVGEYDMVNYSMIDVEFKKL